MKRCAATAGAGDSLSCCRISGHPDEDGEGGHHLHWTARMHGAPPHRYATRAAGGGRWLVCTEGESRDG